MEELWTPTDPLGDALHFLRLSGAFYCRSEMSAPWGLALPELNGYLMFHVVTSGRCWLEVGAERQLLRAGELALVPHGEGHLLASEPDARAAKLFDLPHEHVSERYAILRHGEGGEPTTLVCGVVRMDHPAARQLLALLPPVLRIDAWSSPERAWLESTLRFLTAEAKALRPGGETVITRLADILIIQAIRTWIAEDPAAQTGWLGALHDDRIGRAISRIHREPEREWSVASLAREVGMSRSAFSARFTQLVGEPAMRYVARWRMHVASSWLREDGARIGDVAARLGYRSEAAFSRAFKRYVGVPPSAARTAESAGPLP